MRFLPGWLTVVLVLVAPGCSGAPEAKPGDLLLAIDFVRARTGPDCVRLITTDVVTRPTATVKTEQRLLALDDQPASGSLRETLTQPSGWSPRIAVSVELLSGSCTGPVLDSSAVFETSFETNVFKVHSFRLEATDLVPDAGVPDAGVPDAGDGGM